MEYAVNTRDKIGTKLFHYKVNQLWLLGLEQMDV